MKYSTKDLVEMLTYIRPSGSRGEQAFIRKYIDTVPRIRTDRYGNKKVSIGTSDTLFTSHTDTVHRSTINIQQKVFVTRNIAHTDGSDVLGADDGTGVWLMLNMIYSGVPGHYIFQRHEEEGGLGSEFSAKTVKPKIKKVISFDRKDFGDVITHQSSGRTCSREFAQELANRLGGSYRPSTLGSFTDSANYDLKVPECTNISIGYANAHTPRETQSITFANWLVKRLVRINFKTLPVVRDPNQISQKNYGYGWKDWSYKDDYKDDISDYNTWWKR